MSYDDLLKNELIKIAGALQPHDIKLIVGGGYGLLLKTEYILETKQRTRIEPIPAARSTTDLDFFLSAEIITSAEKIETIRNVLDEDYEPIETARYYQFIQKQHASGLDRPVKIDLLAPPPQDSEQQKLISKDARRIRPKGFRQLHARLTEEAVTLEEYLLPLAIAGLQVFLPHPFSYLILKLFAMRDRKDDVEKGPYHAFDIFRIAAMTTESEWKQSVDLSEKYSGYLKVKEAAEIVRTMMTGEDAEGVRLIKRFADRDEQIESNIPKMVEDLYFLFVKPQQ